MKREGKGAADNQPMRLRRSRIYLTYTYARANDELATRVRIGPFPVPVQGYPRSLCSKTLAINLRGGLGSERERAATWPRRSAPPG